MILVGTTYQILLFTVSVSLIGFVTPRIGSGGPISTWAHQELTFDEASW